MKISMLGIGAALLLGAFAAVAEPLTMPQLSGKPGLNGVLPGEWAEWGQLSELPVAGGPTAKKGPFKVDARFAYDAENLYCGVRVPVEGRNDLPVYGRNAVAGYGNGVPVLNDAVGLSLWNADGKCFTIFADASGITMNQINGRYVPTENLHKVQGRVVKGVGYDLLFTVPWKVLGMTAPEAGKQLQYRLVVLEWRAAAATNQYASANEALPLIASGKSVAVPAVKEEGVELVDISAKDPIINFGYPGRNSAEMLDLLNTYLDWKPTLAIVMIGTNDVVWGAKSTDASAYRKYVKGIMEKLQKAGCKVIWVTAPPCNDEITVKREGSSHLNGISPNVKIAMENRIAMGLAQQYNIPVVDFWLACARRGDFDGPTSLIRNPANNGGADGVHPTQEGYQVLAEMIAKCIWKNNLPTDRIACYGDSITFGSHMQGFNATVGEVYPACLRKLLFPPKEK